MISIALAAARHLSHTMPSTKATPKAGITLFSNDGGVKFVHSPTGAADFSLKHPFGKRLTMGVGFTVREFSG